MSYDLSNQLVIGIASSALFDLTDSDAVFQLEGWHDALSAATTAEELASTFAALLASTNQ